MTHYNSDKESSLEELVEALVQSARNLVELIHKKKFVKRLHKSERSIEHRGRSGIILKVRAVWSVFYVWVEGEGKSVDLPHFELEESNGTVKSIVLSIKAHSQKSPRKEDV